MGITGIFTETNIRKILDMCGESETTISYFVETGTYKAESALEAAKIFKHVYTIELMEPLWQENVKNRARDNITYVLGDSVVELEKIVNEIDGPAFWFIDAHQSGEGTGNNGIGVPLLLELNVILSQKKTGIFVFDDVRLFGNFWDWKNVTIESIDSAFLEKGYTVSHNFLFNDKYIVKAM